MAVRIRIDHLEVILDPASLGVEDQSSWTIRTPRPTRKPFREAKIRIDAVPLNPASDQQLVKLLADAFEVQALVIASPHLSLNQLAKQVGRCRKQMAKLLSVSWLSPRIIESISDGTQPKAISRARLLETELPVDWAEQEALFGRAA